MTTGCPTFPKKSPVSCCRMWTSFGSGSGASIPRHEQADRCHWNSSPPARIAPASYWSCLIGRAVQEFPRTLVLSATADKLAADLPGTVKGIRLCSTSSAKSLPKRALQQVAASLSMAFHLVRARPQGRHRSDRDQSCAAGSCCRLIAASAWVSLGTGDPRRIPAQSRGRRGDFKATSSIPATVFHLLLVVSNGRRRCRHRPRYGRNRRRHGASCPNA